MKLPRLGLLVFWLSPVLGFSEAVAAVDTPAVGAPISGKFAWADLVTTDPEAAANFYTKTFGWTARPAGPDRPGYTLLLNAGRPVGGIAFRPAEPGSRMAHGARWLGSIAVADINQAVAAVKAAGGTTVLVPRKVAGLGWQAIAADREGSLFGLVVTDRGDTAKGKGTENSWAWVQLLAHEPAEAAAFYEQALGYVVTDDARTERTDDFLLTRDGVAYAGLTGKPDGKDTRSGWLGYIRVSQVQATVDAALALGGHVLVPPRDIAGTIQVAVITDPLGGAIGLVSVPARGGEEGGK